ncbi:MAG: Metal-dependent hydrolases of the beta-lactamase superfamily III [uncultured Nocardioidaceae bacterium]|uniref:Metal-dependent hydrolases of the beta-lactamase superfamily III n=1 Tax=uncultured Nocardioidaceae bacterium TaxID=253824 RepID=A0A6J4LKV1_9ACTN|nr:MAG: Metal-dependent hydrolases of the beta-lactamase superfamily III [uncultured Nocardioidaceae bacterium]
MGAGVKLTVIGCSGSFPGPDSPASCYLVESDAGEGTTRILLDLGSGALGTLQSFVDPLAIDAVFITHLHADHFFDMSGYYVMRRYHPDGPQPRIPAYGPNGTAERLARSYGLPLDPGMHEEFDFGVYDGEPTRIGPFTVDVARVVHPVEAWALRVTDGTGVLVYSGDTGPCGPLVELAKDADLLLAEASFREGGDYPEELHMTGREAGQAAADAGARMLVLTHIPPWYDKELAREEARPVFDGPIEIARTGATYDI